MTNKTSLLFKKLTPKEYEEAPSLSKEKLMELFAQGDRERKQAHFHRKIKPTKNIQWR